MVWIMKHMSMRRGAWNTCLCGVECVHLGSIHTVLLWQNTAKCYPSPFPAPFILAWKPLLRLASWFSLPLNLEGVRMLLPYPSLLKRHFIAKEVLVQWKAKWGYLSMALCAHRVPWGYWTPEAVVMIYQVASWELWVPGRATSLTLATVSRVNLILMLSSYGTF